MASLLIDKREDLLYVKRLKSCRVIYSGYKRDYLTRDLSEMEEGFLVCKVCSGITRNASIYREETSCLMCSESSWENGVKMVRKAVDKLDIKCPLLRHCTWEGKLSEAEFHLDNCGYFVVRCKCNSVLLRKDLYSHQNKHCPLRLVECSYCNEKCTAEDNRAHLKQCSKYPIICSNQCGAKFPREELSQHKAECEFEVLACPYTEYGCQAMSMCRRELLAHKKEFYIEHQDLIFVGMKAEIKELKQEIEQLTKKQTDVELKRSTIRDQVEWVIICEELNDNQLLEGPTFYVNNYHLMVYLNPSYNTLGLKIQLRFCLKRIRGQFDDDLGRGYISNYKIILINQFQEDHSYSSEGQMNYELVIGKRSEYFGFKNLNTLGWNLISAQLSNTMVVRFYFEFDTHKPLTKVKPLKAI